MVGRNVDICAARCNSDRGDMRRHCGYSGWSRIEITARQVGRAMASDGVVTVAVVEVGFIPIMGIHDM